MLPSPPRRWAVRRAVRRYRRPLAACCAGAAAWAALGVMAPPAADAVPVAVAARDLPAGATVTEADVVRLAMPGGAVPDGATTPAAGAVLAAPVRRGEPFTDVRLVGSASTRPAGTVVVIVRTADPAATLTVRPGDRVDVLAGPDPAGDPGAGGHGTGGSGGGGSGSGAAAAGAALGRELLVLDVPAATGTAGETAGLLDGATGGVDTAGVLVLAVDRAVASRVAAATGRPLTVTVVGP